MNVFFSLAPFSIFLAAAIAIFRFRAIHPMFYPFIYCQWVGAANEIFSHFLILSGQYTIINGNLYVLVESFFLVWLFREMGTIRSKAPFGALLLLLAGVWLAENVVFGSLTHYSRFFRIFYSFVIVFLSINTVNKMIFSQRRLLRDARFLLCLAFIIYFTYKALACSFVLSKELERTTFLLYMFHIMGYVNFVTNLLYALVVLWMPGKPNYSQLSLSPLA